MARSKIAMLEMRSEGAFKKIKWKSCNVKLTTTYLLHFKDLDNVSKPDGMVLLNNVTKVNPHSSKDVAFSFEVHFKNTKTSPNSPWIFNTTSSDDRIGWMEAIKPGSAQLLKQMESTRRSLSSHSHSESPEPIPSESVVPQPNLKQRGSLHKQSEPQASVLSLRGSATLLPLASSKLHVQPPVDLTQSAEHVWKDRLPQDYVEPNAFPAPDPTQSLPVNMLRQNGHPPPIAKRPNHTYAPDPHGGQRAMSSPVPTVDDQYEEMDPPTKPSHGHAPPIAKRSNKSYSHKPSQGHPKLESRSASLPDDNQYEEMDPSPNPKPKPRPRPRKKPTPESSPDKTRPLKPPTSPNDDILGDEDDSDYLSLIPSSSKPNPETPAQSAGVPPDVAEQLMKTFNKDQLGALVKMLQQVEVESKGGVPSSPLSPELNPENSFRGSFKRALSHAPELTSEKMLVTEDDDDESYEPRPEWAKAVQQGMTRVESAEGQLDTLSALQEDAQTIFREDLHDLEQIGEGQFGKVYRGTLNRGIEKVDVAVKTSKISSTEKQQSEFLKEMKIMSQLMHPNIVRLYGLVQKGIPAPPWIVLEFLKNGDLKTFLSNNSRPLPRLVKYMVDISMGMHYLSEKGLVHRDLAARNVLVSDTETCKVADFGLLRELPKDDSFYHMQTNVPCPVRWMPPESISDRNFSTASDVWSFGVLIWEMFSPTKTPYTNLGNIEVATKVIRGYRLPTPRKCPPVVARIMKACWHENPKKRPSFLLISTLLTTRVSYPPEFTDQYM